MKQSTSPQIALVNANDDIIGYSHKLKVHEEGLLHRAFSIFVFNKKGQMLIHQRAHHKYHSPSLWTNTCCSHLYENMTMDECIHDRLQFEMGFDAEVNFKFKFTYRESFSNGLTEHETDHVYVGIWDGEPNPNVDEVAAYKWISMAELKSDRKQNPHKYTYWFKHIIDNFDSQII